MYNKQHLENCPRCKMLAHIDTVQKEQEEFYKAMDTEPVEWICGMCGINNPDYNESILTCESCGTEFASGDVEYINT